MKKLNKTQAGLKKSVVYKKKACSIDKQIDFQCKMSFDPGLSNQIKEVTFNQKLKKISYPSISINVNSLNPFFSLMDLG